MDKNKDLLPCGHPRACVQIGEEVADGHYVHYCGWCASLEQLQHQRRLWKFAAKLHREQHLAFQEICHAQAERIIDLHSERQRLREALEAIGQARAWAAVWKRAAKVYRRMATYYHNRLYANTYTGALKEENDRKDAEIRRLRAVLETLC
ncbi:MAG: hypothetical protein GWN58_59950, partial [Anaerolineae bacterium]|nr:hypothetical protein [Anaerolineae bacterium]